MTSSGELLRATLFHTPRDPFHHEDALVAHQDGALLIVDGRIQGCGEYSALRWAHPDANLRDLRGGFLLPGFIDTHIHYPQVRIIGSLGRSLLDWLDFHTLPEESRFADEDYARIIASQFVTSLAMHGTTTALVFGSHFSPATAALFETAHKAGLRFISGLVLSDRLLRPELHQSPNEAYRESKALIQRFHSHGRLHYAVTPRFALSTTEAMLEVCQTLLKEHSGVYCQTHINENQLEVAAVAELFPGSSDYLSVYERFGLAGPRTVLAHNVYATESELDRLASHQTAVAHCPCSNAALGSGFFALSRHIDKGITVALGTDVGGGTGFGLLKEGLQSYLLQRLAPSGYPLRAAHMLYLATRAGALALGLEATCGDFTPGKAADFVYLKPPAASPLANVVNHAENTDHVLAALFTLGGSETVQEVRVQGELVYAAGTNS